MKQKCWEINCEKFCLFFFKWKRFRYASCRRWIDNRCSWKPRRRVVAFIPAIARDNAVRCISNAPRERIDPEFQLNPLCLSDLISSRQSDRFSGARFPILACAGQKGNPFKSVVLFSPFLWRRNSVFPTGDTNPVYFGSNYQVFGF